MRGLAKAGLGALQPLILALWFSLGTALAYDAEDDLTQVPFEELVKQEVITASKLSRQISASPSAVTVVTANDIRAYGYRTIADVINSIPGLSTFTDRDYAYLGGRGLGGAPGGEYAGRIMLLIDGYATQDNIFNQAYIDNSGLLDMEMVERVEYVPGTGSAIYGNNAMFGIINVVTKKGASFNGAQVSLEGASLGGRKERLTYGKRTEGGWDMLFSASSLESDGQSGLYYPGLNYPFLNYPFLNRGIINNMDWERGQRLFGKIERDGLSLEAGWVKREKPSIYNLAPTLHGRLQSYLVSDENGFVNIRYETDLGLALKSSSRFYMGRYANRDSWQYAPALYSLGYYSGSNNVVGEWRGFEQQFVATWFQDHMLLFGLEYRDDSKRTVGWNILRQDLSVFLKGSSEFPRKTLSAYLTDEWTLGPKWKLNLGARYDRPNDVKAALSPRVALI
jgi:iron complex outermembrane receptor protein